MNARKTWQRSWPCLAAAVGGFALAWVLIAAFVFPPGAPPADAKVPNVVGLSFELANQRLQQAGFKAQRGELRYQEAAPKSSVVQMTPSGGSSVPLGTAVTLDLSAGQRMDAVPNVVGMTPTQADSALTAVGLTTASDTIAKASDEPVGSVIETRPAGGVKVVVPSAVQIVVSAGPATIAVPDLSGRTIVEARVLLEQLGLTLGDVTILNGGNAGGQEQRSVVQQDPAPGTLVPAGARVTLSVSGGRTP